ncbi:MocR-like pyridoxine biosynthesis transcription factor PdxR [Chryseobacterium sp. CT-SW4]|uniref:MocR-like pyridoxine biosynthesis transcription factor PdxR n=1 Tax=Chryseobacterium sp. SW-1 TaxID=3157343 RepID=UPI003B016250
MLRPWKIELQIDKSLQKPIYLQIADAVIHDIYYGRLKFGDVLPGSRNMAKVLNVNRNTVVEAYDVLLSEEWVVSKERKGIFVSDKLPDLQNQVGKDEKVLESEIIHNSNIYVDFDDGSPDTKLAPIAELARAHRQIFNRKGKWQMMGYSDEQGDVEFRVTLAQMLNHERGMFANHEDIFITRGSQMALYLAAHCFLEKGDKIIVENPGFKSAWDVFENAETDIIPVNVDREGIEVDEIRKLLKNGEKIKAVYVTPHHQYPTTVTLSLKRRLELISLSNEYGITIIEDDYNNEFHFGYRPLFPMSSFQQLKNYIYIGSMSKVVAPALRIGYLVTKDKDLLKKIRKLRRLIDVQGDNIMEQAVLELINDGTIKRHIKKVTAHYKAKRDKMYLLLDKHLKDMADYTLPKGGLSFWLRPKVEINWEDFIDLLLKQNIKIIHPETYSFDRKIRGFRISYGSTPENKMEDYITIIADIFNQLKQ